MMTSERESLDRAVEEARARVVSTQIIVGDVATGVSRNRAALDALIAAVSAKARAEERERHRGLVDAALTWQNRRNEWFDAELADADVLESAYERAKDSLADAIEAFFERARSSEEAGNGV